MAQQEQGGPVDANAPDFSKQMKNMEKAVAKPRRTIPKGIIVMTLESQCPPGFTRTHALDGRFVKGAEAGETPGLRGGSATHTHKAVVDIGHTHQINGDTEPSVSATQIHGGAEGGRTAPAEHTHEFSATTDALKDAKRTVTTDAASSEPRYMTVLFCTKD